MKLLAALTALLIVGSAPVLSRANDTSGGKPVRYWILQGPRLEAEAMATDPRSIEFFSNPSRVVIYPAVAAVPAPSSWHVILWRKFASLEHFQEALDHNKIPKGVQIIGYDNEKWQFTPENEKADPVGYSRKFAELAHSHGYKVMLTPAINLMNVLHPRENKYTAFVNSGLAKQLAPYGDFYHIQAQGLQQNIDGAVPSWNWFVKQMVDQIHAANPNAVITLGISTNTPGAHRDTAPQDIANAVHATDFLVHGYWLNVVGPAGQKASDALDIIDANHP